MWLTAGDDLRNLLSDGTTDKLVYRKKVFGQINSSNTAFKTFEFRRVTDFTSASLPLGVFVDDQAVAVSSDDLPSGEFQIGSAPDDGSVVTASYYYQWFLDSEIVTFLVKSSDWLGFGDNYVNTAQGLRPAALDYAASDAYRKLANRWSTLQSATYQLEDAPDPKQLSLAATFLKLADSFLKSASEKRDDFYKRQGQALAPNFRSIQGRIGPITPRR